LIPLALVNLITAAAAIACTQDTGLPARLTTILATAATVAAGVWLAKYAGNAEPVATAAEPAPAAGLTAGRE
jgi:hypothetical protein